VAAGSRQSTSHYIPTVFWKSSVKVCIYRNGLENPEESKPPGLKQNTDPAQSKMSGARSLSDVLLRTFALRMAVMTTYGHLGSLQNLSRSSHTALPRMITFILFPTATLFDLCTDHFKATLILVLNRILKGKWAFKNSLMVSTGLYLPFPNNRPVGSSGNVVGLWSVPYNQVTHTPAPRTWDAFLLKVGRCVTLLVVLAQAVACLSLVVRRWQAEDAILLLDSANGVYAAIGILSACSSLLITAVGGEWEYSGVVPPEDHSATLGSFNYWQEQLMFSVFVVMFRGQNLIGRPTNFQRKPGLSLIALPLAAPDPPVVVSLTLLSAAVLYCANNSVLVLYRKWKMKNWGVLDIVYIVSDCWWKIFMGVGLAFQLIFCMTSVYELVVIAQGRETAVWGRDTWRWSDPWSDRLFVY
jgi:hypothetical protein